MSLYRRDRIWHYDFWYRGDRYRGSTEQTSRTRAKRVEALLMLQAREKQVWSGQAVYPACLNLHPAFSIGWRLPCWNKQPIGITNTACGCLK